MSASRLQPHATPEPRSRMRLFGLRTLPSAASDIWRCPSPLPTLRVASLFSNESLRTWPLIRRCRRLIQPQLEYSKMAFSPAICDYLGALDSACDDHPPFLSVESIATAIFTAR